MHVWYGLARAILAGAAAAVLLKVLYYSKGFSQHREQKPGFAMLPKYSVSVPISGENTEESLRARLAEFGFRETSSSSSMVKFARGHALGDFSIKIAKVSISMPVPVSNPAQLEVEYGTYFGCAFDTGDLWKFCTEMVEKNEQANSDSDPRETGNPYQSPQS